MARLRFRKDHAVGHVGLHQRGGQNFSREVSGLVGVAFAAARAAAQAERHVVLGEDVGQALDFAGVGHGKHDPLPARQSASALLPASPEPSRGSAASGCDGNVHGQSRIFAARRCRDAPRSAPGSARNVLPPLLRRTDRDPRAAPGCRRRCARGPLPRAPRCGRIPASESPARRAAPPRAAADRTCVRSAPATGA